MKRILLLLAFCLWLPSASWAQCNGIFHPQTACGTVAGGIPGEIPFSVFGGPGGTSGQLQTNNGSGGFAGITPNQDCTINGSTGVVNCTKLQNIPITTTGGTTNDVMYNNGSGWIHNTLISIFNSVCSLAPNTCTSFFGYANVIWYGAVHNGTTDDSPAFSATFTGCITTLSYNSCTIYVPSASNPYCLFSGFSINTGLTTNGGIRLMGGGVQGTNLSACGHTTNPVLTLNNQWIHVTGFTVIGYGFGSDPIFTGTPATQPAILLNSGCSSCVIEDVYTIGGTAAIQNNGACGYTISNVWGSFSYGDGSHVFGFFSQINCGGTVWNSHFDMVYPLKQPAHGVTVAAWQATHAYTATDVTNGTIVSVTCNSRAAWIQIQTAGTSGGSAPNCKPFGQSITDGTAVWQFVNFTISACIQLDTGSIETEIIQTDATCAANINIWLSNTYAGTAPSQNSIIRSTPGGAFGWNVNIGSTTTHTTILGLETSYEMLPSGGGVLIDGISSGTNIIGIDCLNGFSYCVNITAAANNISVSNMHATSGDAGGADFNVTAAATGFKLENSTHVAGSGNLFTIAAVAANHYFISGNICNGTGSSDGGTGTAKLLVPAGGCGAANAP
jgi:hypothetical protein